MRKRTLALALGIGATSLFSGGQQAQAFSLFFTDARYDGTSGPIDTSRLAGQVGTIPALAPEGAGPGNFAFDNPRPGNYIRTVDFEQGGFRDFNLFLNPYQRPTTSFINTINSLALRLSTNPNSGGANSRELFNVDFSAASGVSFNVISANAQTAGNAAGSATAAADGSFLSSQGIAIDPSELKINFFNIAIDPNLYNLNTLTGPAAAGPILLGTVRVQAPATTAVSPLVADGEGDLILSVGRITANGSQIQNRRNQLTTPFSDATFDDTGNFASTSDFGDQPYTSVNFSDQQADFINAQVIDAVPVAVPVPLETDLAGVLGIAGLATVYWRHRQRAQVSLD